MRFEHLSFPPQWKDYWTKYPHGMTILESLIDWATKTNDLIDNVNDWNTYLDDFVASFDENLKQEVTETVQSWIASGYIEVVISAALQTEIDDLSLRLDNTADEIHLKIKSLFINPDDFPGTDVEKLRQAIEKAVLNKASVIFPRLYNITGHTIVIDKPDGRDIMHFIGMGGGIVKNDSGSIFTAVDPDMGDIVSSNMRYKSIVGVGTIVWDGDKLIRVNSTNDSYVNVDTVMAANTRYAQTMKFYGCTITGGNGWAFEWKKSYDVVIDSCTIEHRQNAIRNTYLAGNPDNNTLRIVNNVIEGLTGKAMDLGSSFGVTITGNYFELNAGGYIDMSKSLNYHNGLTFIGNTFQPSANDRTNEVPMINLGRMGSNGVFSSGNVSTGVLYQLTSVGTPGRLTSIGDISYINKKAIGDTELLRDLGRSDINPFA